MTTRHHIAFGSVSRLTTAALFGIVLALWLTHNTKISTDFSLPSMIVQSPIPTTAPTPTVQTFSQMSPDGNKKVIMTVTQKTDLDNKTYTFTTTDSQSTKQQEIYTTTLPNTESMSIPFNTWSPDDTYLFLQHTTKNGSEAFVFRGDGTPVTSTEKYLNATSLFAARNTNTIYKETTGWASETLLIINTVLSHGTQGPSYWFEVPSKAIIQLSTEF